MDTDSIVTVLSYVIPVLIAWFIKSPFGRRVVPSWLADVLANLHPQEIERLYQGIRSREARRESVISWVQMQLTNFGINITYDQSAEFVDYLTRVYQRAKLIK